MFLQRYLSVSAILWSVQLMTVTNTFTLNRSTPIDITGSDPLFGGPIKIDYLGVFSNRFALPENTTSQNLPLYLPGSFDHACSSSWGSPLPVACRYALRQMPDSSMIVKFGDRRNVPKADVSLPFRMSSRKCDVCARETTSKAN